jgi:hypothetical protein
MKNYITSLILTVSLFFLYSCEDTSNTPSDSGGGNSGPVFLVATNGNSDGLTKGLYRFTNTPAGPNFEFITEYHPWNMSLTKADMNNGRIAIKIDRNIVPEGKSGTIYMDKNSLSDINWLPIPEAPEKHFFVLQDYKPQVLPDGKIAYAVTLNTDNPYDDAHWGMVAIYNPKDGKVELSGNVSEFVLAQPEQGNDTEGGSMSEIIASPDGKYIYCRVYGYGTDMGVYHVDYHFIAKYEIGKPNQYTRVAQIDARPQAITPDGKFMVLSGDGLQRIDLQTLDVQKVDDYSHTFHTGQIASTKNQIFKVWRGSGMATFDISASEFTPTVIIDGKNMEGSHKGLRHCGQYSADESKIYFTGSTDFYTNYASELRLYSTPIMENNTTPDSITTIPIEYCTNFFLLLR